MGGGGGGGSKGNILMMYWTINFRSTGNLAVSIDLKFVVSLLLKTPEPSLKPR